MNIDLTSITPKEVIPGFRGRFVHMENYTIGFWEVDPGAILPEHAHVNEQTSQVTEGKFEMTIDGKTEILSPGKIVTIGAHVPHSGRALTPCKITDTFAPARPEYTND